MCVSRQLKLTILVYIHFLQIKKTTFKYKTKLHPSVLVQTTDSNTLGINNKGNMTTVIVSV